VAHLFGGFALLALLALLRFELRPDPPALLQPAEPRLARLLPAPEYGGGQWHLVYVPAAEGELAERSEQALLILQQLHVGLGRKQARVQALVLAAENPAARVRFPHVEWQAAQVSDATLQGRIVLVDPRGLALLRYAVEPGPEQAQRVAGDIRSDLLRLMNYDRSGV